MERREHGAEHQKQHVTQSTFPDSFAADEAQRLERLGIPKASAEVLKKLDTLTAKYMRQAGLVEPEQVLEQAYGIISDSGASTEDKADLMMHIEGFVTVVATDETASEALSSKVKKEYLPALLGPQRYQQMSQEVGQLLRTAQAVPQGFFGELDELTTDASDLRLDPEVLASDLPALAAVSSTVRGAVIDRLIDSKLIKKTDTSYHFPKKKTAQKHLLSGELELAEGWQRAKQRAIENNEIRSLDDAEATMEQHNDRRAISEIVFETHKPGFSIAPLNALRIGHQDSLEGIRLVRRYAERLHSLDEEEKPDVLLVTDLVQGVFKHNQSQKRSALADGLQDANAQFRIAHEVLGELKKTGIPIVVGMSENDHREAKDLAIDAVRELEAFLKDAEKNDFVHFSQMYKYTQNAMFQDFRRFALDYALPLSQRYGRRLRTGSEMEADTNSKISQSEFMHLYQHIKLGYDLNPLTGIDPEDVIELGTWSAHHDIIYVDDCDLVLRLNDGQEDTVKYRHALGLTAESLLSNHMINPLKLMGSLAMKASDNDTLPTALMTGQQQEAVMATHSGVDIISNTGLTNPMDSVDTRAFYRRTTGDTSLRAFTTRRRAWEPGVYEYGRPAKGVIRYTLYDNDIMERSESIPRMAIVTFNDWQVGSPTAHLDMILHGQALAQRYARRMPVAIHGEGDFIHGFIYPGMAREAQAVGLFDLDAQAEVVNGLVRDSWQEAPKADKEGVFHVVWQPGNHDEAQRVRLPANHSRNVTTTIDEWRRVLEGPRVSPEDSIVQTERAFQSDDGTPVPSWVAHPRYGDVNMQIAHFHINSKNYKGGSGGLAVYDPFKRLEGMGGFEDVQIASGAHHHNRMHTKVNGTWIDIGDANAAGQSEFEHMLGMHHSNMSVKVREIGGGEPMTVTYYTEEALMNIPIEHGPYSPDRLADAGYFDDEGADPLRHGMYSLDGTPRTAEQKLLWHKHREASQWAHHMAEPLHVPRGYRNQTTQRLFEAVKKLGEQDAA